MEIYLEDENHVDDNPWEPFYNKSNNFDFLTTLKTRSLVGRAGETPKGKEGPEDNPIKHIESSKSLLHDLCRLFHLN
jgi:hypothetical protein